MWICPECRSLYESQQTKCDRDRAPLAEVQAHQNKSRYPLLGKIVGDRYHLIGGLGQGGLGTVYLARHLHLGQLFAVKFLDLDTLGVDPETGAKDGYRRDFLKEARVASLIRHDAVVKVSDFGEYENLPYLVMEYVPGPSLLQMLAGQGRFKEPDAINIARRIAEALDSFHERRLVHRDLKPANVILDPRGGGRLTLVDLGLVKDLSGPGGRASTHPLALRGTPGYLAPEQVPPWVLASAGAEVVGEKQMVDARVDLYALGVIFYEMLAGVSPYPEGTSTHIIVYACTKDAIPLSSVHPPPKLRPGLEQLVHDTMARDPARRPATAAEFIERLDELTMGAALAGSWPSIVVPGVQRRRSQQLPSVARVSPPVSTAPTPSTPAATPNTPTERPRPDSGLIPPMELDDSLEGTGIFDRTSGEASMPASGRRSDALLAPAPAAEDQTVEASVDSLDMLMDGPPLGGDLDDSELATRLDDFGLDDDNTEAASIIRTSPPSLRPGAPIGRTSAAEPVPPLRTQKPRGTLVWILVVALVAAVTVAVVLAMRTIGDDRTPTPRGSLPAGSDQDAVVVDLRPPVEHTIVTARPQDAAAPARVVDAGPVDAAPTPHVVAVPDASRPKPKPKPNSRPKPAPKPAPSLGAIERALAHGDRAYQARDWETALKNYRTFRRLADRRHPQFAVVGQRIEVLKGMVKAP